jgi:transposase
VRLSKSVQKTSIGKKVSSSVEIQIQNLDHLGIVAGLIDEIGIVEKINEKLKIDTREKINSGQVVKAMILNGLGMVSRPLYLFSQFFEDKAVEELLGKGIKKEYLNDDKLGRVMDEIYQLGLSSLFVELVLLVIKKFNIGTKYSHLDATSFHLHGEYPRGEIKEENEKVIKERPKEKGYNWKEERITYGGVEQRWLIVESSARKKSDCQKLESKIQTEAEKASKLLKGLEKEGFEHYSQARYQLKGINKKLKFFTVKETKIRE